MLTPTLLPAPDPPERTAAIRRCVRRCVAFGYNVTRRTLPVTTRESKEGQIVIGWVKAMIEDPPVRNEA
jgi:hypothetical protein